MLVLPTAPDADMEECCEEPVAVEGARVDLLLWLDVRSVSAILGI